MSKQHENVGLVDICSSHNTRNPVPNLTLAGLVSDPLHPNKELPTALAFMRNLVFGDEASRAEYVRLIDEYESTGLDSIRSLAEGGNGLPGLKEVQLEPSCLTTYRIKSKTDDGKRVVRYRVVYGERRILAMAYLFAKYGEAKYATVNALVVRVDVEEAGRRGLAENFLRRNPSPSEIAYTYKSLIDGGMKIKEVAEMFFSGDAGKSSSAAYQEVCSMVKLVRGKNKLSPERLAALDRGEIGLTKAKQEAKGKGTAEPKKANRRRVVSLTDGYKLLDDAVLALDNSPKADLRLQGYIEACAEFMQYPNVEAAMEDSRNRRTEAEAA